MGFKHGKLNVTSRPEVRQKMSDNHADFTGINNPAFADHLILTPENKITYLSEIGLTWKAFCVNFGIKQSQFNNMRDMRSNGKFFSYNKYRIFRLDKKTNKIVIPKNKIKKSKKENQQEKFKKRYKRLLPLNHFDLKIEILKYLFEYNNVNISCGVTKISFIPELLFEIRHHTEILPDSYRTVARVYYILNSYNEKDITCPICNKNIKCFHDFENGFGKTCNDINCCNNHPDKFEKSLNTKIERYGNIKNYNEMIYKKNKKTLIKRYGSLENYEEIKESKRQATNLGRYGTEHPIRTDECKANRVKTSIEIYGCDHPMQNDDVRQSLKDTCLERYGFDNPFKVPEIKKKVRKTKFERYGDSSAFNIYTDQPKYSKISQELFDMIAKELDTKDLIHTKYATRGVEFVITDMDNYRTYYYDFVISSLKFCIEYNGDVFHPNKNKLSEQEWKDWKSVIEDYNADEKWAKDQRKNNFLIEKGWTVLTIWDSDFRSNKELVAKQCLESIYQVV